jgi:hypothetical protein
MTSNPDTRIRADQPFAKRIRVSSQTHRWRAVHRKPFESRIRSIRSWPHLSADRVFADYSRFRDEGCVRRRGVSQPEREGGEEPVMRSRRFVSLLAALATSSLPIVTGAQRGETQAPAASARAAPIDLTGYWVSVVTEDWRYRMVTPRKGDTASVPLNATGRQVADAWDPAKDEAAGYACRSYGVGNIMRVPGRAHITWQDDSALKLAMGAGTQTRLLHFGDAAQAPAGNAGWQGYSLARWEFAGPQRRGGPPQRQSAPAAPHGRGRSGARTPPARGGSLKVVTTRAKAGYRCKNGVPYSETAVVTEYFDRHNEPNGDQSFTVTTIVDDPTYLTEPFITSTHFKKEADGARWRPTACTAS